MLSGLSIGEILFIVVIVLVLFGSNAAMGRIKTMGKELGKVKKELDDIKDTMKM